MKKLPKVIKGQFLELGANAYVIEVDECYILQHFNATLCVLTPTKFIQDEHATEHSRTTTKTLNVFKNMYLTTELRDATQVADLN